MERTENLIMQEDRWKPLKEMNLTDDFLFDVATAELERRSEGYSQYSGKTWNPNGFCRRI